MAEFGYRYRPSPEELERMAKIAETGAEKREGHEELDHEPCSAEHVPPGSVEEFELLDPDCPGVVVHGVIGDASSDPRMYSSFSCVLKPLQSDLHEGKVAPGDGGAVNCFANGRCWKAILWEARQAQANALPPAPQE